ncbi:MAG: hypothetical protein JNM36_01495 [Chitinophagales bacterium]|nr:hypothetical protein [Chitinophagales bacterium]
MIPLIQRLDMKEEEKQIIELLYKNAEDAKKESSKSYKISMCSLIIALLSLIISIISAIISIISVTDGTQKQIKEEISLQSKQQKELLQQQILTNQNIYNILDSIYHQTSDAKRTTDKKLKNIHK